MLSLCAEFWYKGSVSYTAEILGKIFFMITDKSELEAELKQALKSGDKIRLNTIRMVLTAVKLAEVDRKGPLDQDALIAIVQKQAKMRQESIGDATKAKREDLIPDLETELSILEGYLPEPLSEDELKDLVTKAIESVDASGPEDMGKVMKEVMPQVSGKADGKVVSQLVRSLLTEAVDSDEQ
jgi:uncharacterized protein YqeY